MTCLSCGVVLDPNGTANYCWACSQIKQAAPPVPQAPNYTCNRCGTTLFAPNLNRTGICGACYLSGGNVTTAPAPTTPVLPDPIPGSVWYNTAVEEPKSPRCPYCARELCPELDAYYGKDAWSATVCDTCRRYHRLD